MDFHMAFAIFTLVFLVAAFFVSFHKGHYDSAHLYLGALMGIGAGIGMAHSFGW